MAQFQKGDVVWFKKAGVVDAIRGIFESTNGTVKYQIIGDEYGLYNENDGVLLTNEMMSAAFQIQKHKEIVGDLIEKICKKLIKRAANHDQSKFSNEEFENFVKYTPKLKEMTYGSREYKDCLDAMAPALKHHYEENNHHPEHYENGIDDMDLVDLIEMLVDWKSASEKHNDGDIHKSIEINTKRFQISPQLKNILANTIKNLE